MAELWRLITAIGINPKQVLECLFHLDCRFLDWHAFEDVDRRIGGSAAASTRKVGRI